MEMMKRVFNHWRESTDKDYIVFNLLDYLRENESARKALEYWCEHANKKHILSKLLDHLNKKNSDRLNKLLKSAKLKAAKLNGDKLKALNHWHEVTYKGIIIEELYYYLLEKNAFNKWRDIIVKNNIIKGCQNECKNCIGVL